MDFLNPKKRRAHAVRLMIGYVLLAIAILLGTTVLLYQANGFDVRQGKIIQNGLIFVSSRPGGASVYLNGQRRDSTGARMVLPAGSYKMELRRNGYHNWQRGVTLEGNSVSRFDYPMLIPTTLSATDVANYEGAPPTAVQSPDRRFVLVQQPGKPADFDVYDLRAPDRLAAGVKRISIPASVLTEPDSPASFKLVEASNDNRHFLMLRTYGDQQEYIMIDRQVPAESRNLTTTLKLPAGAALTLQNKRYDHYFIHDTATGALGAAELGNPTVTRPLAQKVSAYKTYDNDVVLYATPNATDPAKTDIVMLLNGKSHTIRSVKADSKYLLAMVKYDGDWFVAAGSPVEDRVYVYKNPAERIESQPGTPAVPIDILKMESPSFVKFSANTQFLMATNGSRYATYDNDLDRHYVYDGEGALDAPQTNADWMDGHRIAYVSGGKFQEFDYDGTNKQVLSASLPGLTFFDRDYEYQYAITPSVKTPGQYVLTQTSLLTAADR